MHKSVITFSLFLMMGTLIMLVPFTSITFPNVKAQEYGGSYDYDDDTYSKYPTEVNKYECQTGPFEGFFVSSVEFCKHVKFDDRKDIRDNRTGTQGPPGPTGSAGPQGEQGERGLTGATGLTGMTGPAGEDGTDGAQGERGFNGTQGIPGPNIISPERVYVEFGGFNTSASAPESLATSTARCDSGDVVLGGGWGVSDLDGLDDIIQASGEPLVTNDIYIGIVFGAGSTVHSEAICFDNPPLR